MDVLHTLYGHVLELKQAVGKGKLSRSARWGALRRPWNSGGYSPPYRCPSGRILVAADFGDAGEADSKTSRSDARVKNRICFTLINIAEAPLPTRTLSSNWFAVGRCIMIMEHFSGKWLYLFPFLRFCFRLPKVKIFLQVKPKIRSGMKGP